MPDTSHLYTTVKNPTAADRVYGYLGNHGKRLLAGTTFTFFGNIDRVVHQLHGRYTRKRKALERDLLAGRIVIERTPRPLFMDATTNVVKVLNTNNGTLGLVDPSWGAFTGP